MQLYIPIWFYSNENLESDETDIHALHSNLVLFKYDPMRVNDDTTGKLYIPIWFYSNVLPSALYVLPHCFTFQSGSIQIYQPYCLLFASNSLHSNLVLFKCYFALIVCYFDIFTFQSGSIQISFLRFLNPTPITFTFQSGSIQICMLSVSQ